ncbi:hypothetical protein OCOJLMKI_1185 [Methylobacterium iners]|uniref:Uncharacterized protein n=1 Tax=Methylobacterium iners TaxID=418707 RepID=A0ABQ4RWL5_9HYPH|nr:hypothetical protein OCOJLMKI_1185 [Methylobacterium iners]
MKKLVEAFHLSFLYHTMINVFACLFLTSFAAFLKPTTFKYVVFTEAVYAVTFLYYFFVYRRIVLATDPALISDINNSRLQILLVLNSIAYLIAPFFFDLNSAFLIKDSVLHIFLLPCAFTIPHLCIFIASKIYQRRAAAI